MHQVRMLSVNCQELAEPKPLNPNEWLADISDCKGGYQALQQHLIESVSQQLDAHPSVVA